MQDSFAQKKQAILNDISTNGPDNLDASPKGTIDEHCIAIINLINSHRDMVTTSSCSGRVSVYLEGIQNKLVSKGNEGRWIFVTHDTMNLEDWYKTIDFQYVQEYPSSSYETRSILYKFEALILHVKCRNQSMANKLYSVAMNCGFRESGIGSNYNVAIRTSIKLDVPIGYLGDDNTYRCFVTENYLKYITNVSFDRFKENFKKLEQLYQAIEKYIINLSEPSKDSNDDFDESKCKSFKSKGWESIEERRARMREEGLRKKEELKKAKDAAEST
ncbi:hypothetical protein KGF57_005271 [Candida theae]|uniref:tRNA wybutosine-synthesizing protein 3 n=1 Tax=Candida theae TaxID=1198502 RepID=A0AAD5B9K7_9ASCO|nr:uncharacterized protein KGF57_005271 [Candida theae]KAI5948873.1 hypothetical protein KGF57_005271 [Candida theae]